jgi:hypothetical protein
VSELQSVVDGITAYTDRVDYRLSRMYERHYGDKVRHDAIYAALTRPATAPSAYGNKAIALLALNATGGEW